MKTTEERLSFRNRLNDIRKGKGKGIEGELINTSRSKNL